MSTRSARQGEGPRWSQSAEEGVAAQAVSSAAVVASRVWYMASSFVGNARTNAGSGRAGLNRRGAPDGRKSARMQRTRAPSQGFSIQPDQR